MGSGLGGVRKSGVLVFVARYYKDEASTTFRPIPYLLSPVGVGWGTAICAFTGWTSHSPAGRDIPWPGASRSARRTSDFAKILFANLQKMMEMNRTCLGARRHVWGKLAGEFSCFELGGVLSLFFLVFLVSLLSLNIVTLCVNHQTSEHKHNTDFTARFCLPLLWGLRSCVVHSLSSILMVY